MNNIKKHVARKSDVQWLGSRSVKNLVRHSSKARVVLVPNIEREKAQSTTAFLSWDVPKGTDLEEHPEVYLNDRETSFRGGRDNRESTEDLLF